MKKLDLKYSKILRGEFKPKKLNLLIVFQVNCPGCFVHAIPMAATLYEELKDNIGFFSLSTAFEDFELNTIENTEKMLDEGEMVGETRRALLQRGIEKYPVKINFPVMFDLMEAPQNFMTESFIISASEKIENYDLLPSQKKKELAEQLYKYYSSHEKMGYSFIANMMKGTPTWIIFDKDMNIIDQKFGHVDKAELEDKLKASPQNSPVEYFFDLQDFSVR